MIDLLEYKEEFEVGIREAAESLDEKVDLTNSIRKVGLESDLILAGWIKNWSNDHINEEDMLNVILPRNPLVYVADLSFTFRNETRVEMKKHKMDLVFDEKDKDTDVFDALVDPLVNIALEGGTGLMVSYGEQSEEKSTTHTKFLTHTIEKIQQKIIGNSDFTLFVSIMNINDVNEASKNDFSKITSVENFKRLLIKTKESVRNPQVCIMKIQETDYPKDDGLLLFLLQPNDKSGIGLLDYLSKWMISGLSENIHIKNKTDRLLRETLNSSRQSKVAVVGHISPLLKDLETSVETLKHLSTLKVAAGKKKRSRQEDAEEDPANWGTEELAMWMNLTQDLEVEPSSLIPGSKILRMPRKSCVKLLCKISSANQDIAQQIWKDLRDLHMSYSRRQETRRPDFVTKDAPKKSYFAIMNGSDEEEDAKVSKALGTSKKEFEQQLNKGFEKNVPRYTAKNANMMAAEWSHRVAASDRAEARLYPVLGVDRGPEKGRRRFSAHK